MVACFFYGGSFALLNLGEKLSLEDFYWHILFFFVYLLFFCFCYSFAFSQSMCPVLMQSLLLSLMSKLRKASKQNKSKKEKSPFLQAFSIYWDLKI